MCVSDCFWTVEDLKRLNLASELSRDQLQDRLELGEGPRRQRWSSTDMVSSGPHAQLSIIAQNDGDTCSYLRRCGQGGTLHLRGRAQE